MAKKQSDTVSLPRRIFGVVVTRPAPSAGTGGETELNRGTLQKITGPTGAIHAKFTSPSLRNGLRETAIEAEFSVNRRRVKNAGQPTVTLTGPIDPKENLDDALLGSMVAEKGSGGAQTRDSMLLINEAISLSPYRRDTSYHQSPRFVSEDDSGRKTEASALIHKEVCFSAFQYPFALNAAQVREEGLEAHGRNLLDCLSQLNHVGGNHARNLFTFDPASVVIRVTDRQVPEFDPYGFTAPDAFPSLVRDLKAGDLPGSEFWLGGELVKALGNDKQTLANLGVHLEGSPQKVFKAVAALAFGGDA